MKCPYCESEKFQKRGKDKGRQRYLCSNCQKTWTEDTLKTENKRLKARIKTLEQALKEQALKEQALKDNNIPDPDSEEILI